MVQDIPRKIALLLSLLCLMLLFVGGPGIDAPRLYKDFWDLGHIFCFALWTWLYLDWRPLPKFWSQLSMVLLLAFVIGGTVELLQAQIGRDASWSDLQKDMLGSLIMVLFQAPARNQLNIWLLRSLQLLLAMLFLWTLQPLILEATDELIAWQQFPLLSGFETPLERGRWGGNSRRRVVAEIAHSGRSSLRVDLNTDRYSGIFLRHFPSDWSGFRILRLQVYNPDAVPLTVYFRIHDQLHRQFENAYRDRYNTSFDLQPGWTKLEIPLDKVAAAPKGRKMDMRKIASMGLFVAKLEQPKTVYLDDVELLH